MPLNSHFGTYPSLGPLDDALKMLWSYL